MQRYMSSEKFAVAFSAVQLLVSLPLRIVKRIAASPEAFVDAIERLAKH